jgi:Leucine-rich repeat (LRR) protein
MKKILHFWVFMTIFCPFSNANTFTDVGGKPSSGVDARPVLIGITTQPVALTTLCAGSSTTLSVMATGTGTLTYQWRKDGNPIIGATASNYTVTSTTADATSSTTYTVVVSNGTDPLVISNAAVVEVKAFAIPNITLATVPDICAGSTSFTLPYTTTANAPTTYSIFGTGFTTVTNVSLLPSLLTVNLSSAAVAGTISYTFQLRNANNCASTLITGSVKVNPLPTITLGTIPAICAGGTFFTLPYIATTNVPITYSIGGTGIAAVSNAALPATPIAVNLTTPAVSTKSFILTVTNANGCTSNYVNGSVTVNPLPTIMLGTVPPICPSAASFTLPYTSTLNTPTKYSISGTGLSTVTNAPFPTVLITVNLSDAAAFVANPTYTLTVSNANSCTSPNVTGNIAIAPTGIGTLEGDRLALIDFYNATGGPNWTSTTNTSTNKWLINGACGQSPCGWNGVTCSNNRVVSLSVNNNNLVGSIPPEIGKLTALTSLLIANNSNLTGSIPPEIGNLTALTNLQISSNSKLTGGIPTEIGNLTKLQSLNLTVNQLTGSLPTSIGNLVNLTSLIMNQNKLTGSIPDTLGNLSKLQTLSLSNNQLSGSLPPSLGNLSNLTSLNLYFNQLTGSIPDTLGNLSKLTSLILGTNQLSGSIPASIGNLVNLTNLRLFGNQLTGSIPDSIGKLTKLTTLQLDTNRLTGSIPTSLGTLINLTNLRLNSNQLTGNIPLEMGNLTKLTTLLLTNNQLSDTIPNIIGRLTKLTILQLDSNRLTGSIPDSIRRCTLLTSLRLNDNQLTGNFNLTGVPVAANVRVQNNKLNFDGIETNTALLDVYTPQYKIPITNTIGVLSVVAGGLLANNTYKWYKTDPTTPTLMATNVGNATYSPTTSGTYFVEITNRVAAALTLVSDDILVTIPQGSLTANGPLCDAGIGQLTWTATEGTGPFTVVYNDGTADQTAINVASGTPFDVSPNPLTNTTAFTLVSVTGSGLDASVRTSGFNASAATITVNYKPVITVQPVLSTTLCAGVNTTLKVTATGTGLAYQWKKDGVDVGTNADSFDVLSATTDTASTAIYTVGVSGTCTPSLLSENSTIIVNALPKITVQPTASTTICAGNSPLNLRVTATGTGLSYQWRKGGNDILGATAANFDVTSTTSDTASTSKYSVVVSGTCTPSQSSDTAIVVVNALLNVTARPSATTNICVGTTATLTVAATGTGLTYQWKKNGNDISGANQSNYVIDATVATDAGTYSVVIGSTCSRNDTAKTVLIIDPKPAAIQGDPSVYATFSTTFTNPIPGGQWSSSNPATATVDATTGVVKGLLFGTTTISYTLTNACGVNTVTKDFTVIRNTVKVALKAFLQGPYNPNNGLMDATLRLNDFVPTTEPYSGMSNFTHKGQGGGELFENRVISTVIGNNAIVDWVFIELRDKTTPSKVVATRAALIQRDGDIVDTDGTSALLFNDVIAGDYYIAVRHRNHLGFRTATPKSLTVNVLNLNFSDGTTPLFGTNSLKLIGATYMMYSGNGDSNGAVNAIDKNGTWLKTNGQFNYLSGDFNLDGVVNAFDINEHWRLNNARVQQLD